MKWPPWNPPEISSRDDSASTPSSVSWESTLNVIDWQHYTDPRTYVPTIILTGTALVFVRFYRSYLRRIPQAGWIEPTFFRRRSLLGQVTSVGDADNFRLFHTPGGRLAGWGWRRHVPTTPKELKDRTIHVRLAGVDAPELAHFGKPAQPYSKEALDWLTAYILHRRVRAYVYKRDQYERVVATVYVWRGLLRRDVGLEMLKKGWATVYEARIGAEFGNVESSYRSAEATAKRRRRGMWRALGTWGTKKGELESPRDYKTRTADHEKR